MQYSPAAAKGRRRALVLRIVLVAALLVVLAVVSLLFPKPERGGLRVATVTGSVEPSGVLQGTLAATRVGDEACFSISTRGTTSVLRFVDGWSAQERLALVGPAGSVVAQPGSTVTVLGEPGRIGSVAGCAQRGRIWTVTSVRLSTR